MLMEPELKPLITALIIFAALLCIYGLIPISVPMIIQDEGNRPIGEIYGSRTIGQSFVATENGLDRIDINMATYNRINTKEVFFRLKEENATQDLVNLSVNANQIKDNSYHSFMFEPIPDSYLKSYVFSIQSPESVSGNSITLYYDTMDVYPNGTALVNNSPVIGDLRFKVYNKVSKLDILSSFIKNSSKDIIFAVFYIVLVGGIVFGIIWLYVHDTPKNPSK